MQHGAFENIPLPHGIRSRFVPNINGLTMHLLEAGCESKDRVWSKNSCGFTRVVFQQSSEPFTTLKWAYTLYALVDRRKEQHVALALMIPLMMKMRHILRQRMAERRFPKQDQP